MDSVDTVDAAETNLRLDWNKAGGNRKESTKAYDDPWMTLAFSGTLCDDAFRHPSIRGPHCRCELLPFALALALTLQCCSLNVSLVILHGSSWCCPAGPLDAGI